MQANQLTASHESSETDLVQSCGIIEQKVLETMQAITAMTLPGPGGAPCHPDLAGSLPAHRDNGYVVPYAFYAGRTRTAVATSTATIP
jgi:hypothetical protein